ncbi:MAG: alanine dehydrogenase [Thermoflexibacter sp.]
MIFLKDLECVCEILYTFVTSSLTLKKQSINNRKNMIVGVPKEIKNNENRVALTPAGADELVERGHKVYVQAGAGENSGFTDEEYKEVGAEILATAKEVFDIAEMIVKVKEPIEQEYDLIKPNQLVFTYFHFASSEELTHAMIKSNAVCLAYETVERPDRSLPLLIPMSEVAGRMSVQQGAKYLEKPIKGRGILLGGVPGVKAANVLILGGGIVGTHAAKMAAGLGANVTLMDISLPRLRQLDDIMPANVTTVMSSRYNIIQEIKQSDLIIGAVLIPGAKAPKLITRDMLKYMHAGTVMVDVAIDQGGCFETSRPTTHENPTYIIDDVVHYCVANMPGAVPYTSTVALTNATLPYVIQLANNGWKKACKESKDLLLGLNVVSGKVVYKGVAEAWNLPYTEVSEVLA